MEAAATIIEKFGGVTVVARICKVRPQAVSQWKRTGIPEARLMYLQVIRPDVFEDGCHDILAETSVERAA